MLFSRTHARLRYRCSAVLINYYAKTKLVNCRKHIILVTYIP